MEPIKIKVTAKKLSVNIRTTGFKDVAIEDKSVRGGYFTTKVEYPLENAELIVNAYLETDRDVHYGYEYIDEFGRSYRPIAIRMLKSSMETNKYSFTLPKYVTILSSMHSESQLSK